MVKKTNYGKIIAVIFLTILIWVWADLALDVQESVYQIAVSVVKSSSPDLQVNIADRSSGFGKKVFLKEVVFKGPASKIGTLRRQSKQGQKPEIDFDVIQEEMSEPGDYILDVLSFLQKNSEIKQLNLDVTSCDPNTISVNVVRLVEKSLAVECFDKGRNPVKTISIEPPQVEMFVTADWLGPAEVILTQSEIEQAETQPLEKIPYIISSTGQKKHADTTVSIKTSPDYSSLNSFTITNPILTYSLSKNLQGIYEVELDNETEVMSSITIRATSEAKSAYENMSYHVRLEIDDEDTESEVLLKRKVVYNFPPEYLRRDEIRLEGQPVEARFKLLRLAAPQ